MANDSTNNEVGKLLKVYSISSNPNAINAGFTIDRAVNKWDSNKVNTKTTTVTSGDAGTTANKWVQMIGASTVADSSVDYGATTAGTANEKGAMYFVNFGRLVSIENAKASDQVSTTVSNPNFSTATSETRLAVTKNTTNNSLSLTEKGNVPTWGYQADDLADTVKYNTTSSKFEADADYDSSAAAVTEIASSTSPLFQYVRYIDTAAQADIDALMNVLDPVTEYEDDYDANSFTPGWRMVISAAIIQSTSSADVTGNAKDRTTVASPLITISDGAVSLNKGSQWFEQFKGVLDNVGNGETDSSDTSNNVNRKNGQKPQAATGFRETSTFGEWWTKTNNGTSDEVKAYKGDGVPESTNIGTSKDGDTTEDQVGDVDATAKS